MDSIYFDHAATTPLDKRVLDAMTPFLTENYGNANSAHQLGRTSKVAIEDARENIAKLLNAEPSEIIFTSGGTESDNAVIKGMITGTGKNEIITSPIEHHAVLHPAESLENEGITIKYLEPNEEGIITAEQVKNAISENTAIVSLMHVNNEIGSINPIKEIAEVCRESGVPFHSDTVQSIGKIPVDVKEFGMDALSISAHKIYGPKGIGVLYVKNGTPWEPWLQGGSQERKRRGGTSNVPGIVGLSKAMELAVDELENNASHYYSLREFAIQQLDEKFDEQFYVNGPRNGGAPHILNVAFLSPDEKGLDGEMLLLNLDIEGICVSNGSACTSGATEPSHVLSGIGLNQDHCNSSIRISFGKHNTKEEVTLLVNKLEGILDRMLAMAG
ncbi:cysteine desulfurase family protein [Rhodohalobacter sulfatireducens]|uniref:Cysteine desulfurase n=1 Tax=Rhodohalobacter sulfatireducens TaxID=2911366 RepID=A0ABS9KDU0_9BACT|nr:cysteine desulfurase family protein [Rhodohalobacter sulfatireducens]MCG2589023.1 cysteine desulfurase [Rhodohalobacter sulfatireducens]